VSNDFASMMQEGAGPEGTRTSTRLRPGQIVTGTVVQIGHDSVFVDIGMTTEGRIDRRELEDAHGEVKVQQGDSIKANVISIDDVMGPKLSISFGRGRGKLDEGALEAARDARVPVEGVVGAAVKGGVEVRVLGTRAFCPASQLGTEFIADLASLEGQKLEFLITEVKNGGRDVIVSRKALLLEQQARQTEETLAKLEVGNDYSAKVVAVQKYGAFVTLGGGVEGLIHISELSHGRVDRVEDVLKVGEEVTVRLLAITPGEKGAAPKLRLSLRALSERSAPPEGSEPERGEVLEGTVSQVTQYGVFVDTAKGKGLVPTRELGTPRGSDARRMFPIGKPVSVVLVSKDASRGMTFSMARVADVEERQNYRDFARAQKAHKDEPSSLGSFGALLRERLDLPEPAPFVAEAKPSAAGAAPVGTARVPGDGAEPVPARVEQAIASRAAASAGSGAAASAKSGAPAARGTGTAAARPVPKAVPTGPAPADRNRIDTDARSPKSPTTSGPKGDPQAAKEQSLGVVHGRRRPNKG
jgi:small subunit ribosomal protein S1